MRLYKSIVIPQLENAALVWQAGKCEVLDRIQRRGLAICLGVPATASLKPKKLKLEYYHWTSGAGRIIS